MWKGERREFRQVGRNHTLVWTIEVDGATETTCHGVLDGKTQSTSHTYEGVNLGKRNEVSSEDYALDRAARKAELKKREGYREFKDGAFVEERADRVDFDKPLPKNLAFLKPANSIGTGLMKKVRAGKTLFTRKRDGMMHPLRFLEDDAEIYSRRMLRALDKEPARPWEERFPHIYDEMLQLLDSGLVPPNSILLGELIMDRNGLDDFEHVESVTKSLTHKAISDQDKEGYVSFYVWDIAFWDGAPVISTMPTGQRLELLQETLDEAGMKFIHPIEIWTAEQIWDIAPELDIQIEGRKLIYRKQLSEFPEAWYTDEDGREYRYFLDKLAQEVAKHFGWEGFVAVDPEGVYKDRAFNFRGKPDRPSSFTGKLKPLYEDDFIAYWDPDNGLGTYGNGRNQSLVGSLALFQLTEDYEEVYICDVGGGIRDKHGKDYPSGPLRAWLSDTSLYPMVVSVAYDSRTYTSQKGKTNALRFPRILRFREDKDVEECVNPHLTGE